MSNLTINKTVAKSLESEYHSNGWTSYSQVGECNYVAMQKVVQTGSGRDESTCCSFKRPYLIQIGRIRRPLGDYDGERLTAAVEMEYMGAAEFEFGALPKSFRRVQAQMELYTQHKFDSLAVDVGRGLQTLRVFANFDELNTAAQYEAWLTELYAGTLNTKERTGFAKDERKDTFLTDSERFGNYDFWWDIQNDVFFGFDKNFMNRLPDRLNASFAYMDSK